MNSEIKYESTFSTFPFIIFSFGTLLGGIVGVKLLNSFLDKGDFSFIILLPIGFISLSLLSIYALLSLKKTIITKEYLIFSYLFFKRTIKIKWDSITDVRKKFSTTKSSVDDRVYRKGSELKIISEYGNYSISSFFYTNFDKFSEQFEPRVDPTIRKKMKNEFKAQKDKFENAEKRYREIMYKYVLPICIAFVVVMLLWVKLKK